LSFFKDILTNLFSGTLLRKRAGYVIETMQASWRLLFHGWYLNYLDGFHVSSYLNLCSTNFILFETVCCSKVIRRKKFFVTTLCSRSFIHRAHGGQWRDEPVDEQEATCELGASYVKKLFGILFSFSKTNIQSPKFASCELGGHHMWRSSLGPFFHSAKPTFSHQSLHHFSNCTKVSLLSLFLEHDLHCFVLSGFSVNHSSTTTTNWVAGILCKVFWVDLEFGDGGWWLWYYAFGSIKSFRWILLKSLPTGPFKGAPVQPYQLYCSEWLPSIELRSIWFGFCIEWYFSLKGAV
jgi:hypothetical protein